METGNVLKLAAAAAAVAASAAEELMFMSLRHGNNETVYIFRSYIRHKSSV